MLFFGVATMGYSLDTAKDILEGRERNSVRLVVEDDSVVVLILSPVRRNDSELTRRSKWSRKTVLSTLLSVLKVNVSEGIGVLTNL